MEDLAEVTPTPKPKDGNERYNYLIAAAKFCFAGSAADAWARADYQVRTKFKQAQRDRLVEVQRQLTEKEFNDTRELIRELRERAAAGDESAIKELNEARELLRAEPAAEPTE